MTIDGYANGDIWMHGEEPDPKAIINLTVSSAAWDNDVNNDSEVIKSTLSQMVNFLNYYIEGEKRDRRERMQGSSASAESALAEEKNGSERKIKIQCEPISLQEYISLRKRS